MTLAGSYRQLPLALLFLAALPVFCWLRWSPDAWFAGQLQANGLSGKLSYATVDKSFPGMQLGQASIALPGGKQLSFEHLLLRPAFSALLNGYPGLFMHADSDGISAESVIALHDQQLDLSDVRMNADASALARFDSRLLLLGLSGSLGMQGQMLLQAQTGLPLDGSVDLLWDKPAALLLPPGMQQLRLTVNTADANGGKIWNWKIVSSPDTVAGEGKVVAGGPDVQQWLLRGTLRTAKSGAEMALSGTLGAPHLQ